MSARTLKLEGITHSLVLIRPATFPAGVQALLIVRHIDSRTGSLICVEAQVDSLDTLAEVLSEADIRLRAPFDIWLLGRTPTPEQAVALADGRPPSDLALLGKASFAPDWA